jgi:transcriptional regulator
MTSDKNLYFHVMYQMPYFTETDQKEVLHFMQNHPFATLIGNCDGISVATQVPVMVAEKDGEIIIRGHIMRHTDHYLAFEKNPEALVLFTGAHCYVSASWYSERGHGSTWNYMTVHARGKMEILGETETISILRELTHMYEDEQERPELLEDMRPEYVHAMAKAVAGFEIIVRSLYPIFKLSQNKDDESYGNIVKRLDAMGDANAPEIAEEMKKRRNVAS